MKNTATLELKKRKKKNVLMMRLEYTRTLPAGSVDVAHRCVISLDGKPARNIFLSGLKSGRFDGLLVCSGWQS